MSFTFFSFLPLLTVNANCCRQKLERPKHHNNLLNTVMLWVSDVLPLNAEAGLSPLGLILPIHTSDLRPCDTGALLHFSFYPHEGGSTVSREATLIRLLMRQILGIWSGTCADSLRLRDKRVGALLLSPSVRRGKEGGQSTCVTCLKIMQCRAPLCLHKPLFFLLPSNDAGPNP